jgi:anti-sigma-K factor RskA
MNERFGFLGSTCPCGDDAGAYVLRALSDGERSAFAAHLETCADCRTEVEELQVVADQLPMAAPQLVPPPDIRNRLMAIVESEAELLRAAGPEADRVTPAPAQMRLRDRVWWPSWAVSPGFAAAAASVLILAGVGAGVLLSAEDGPGPVRTVPAQVASSTAAVAHVAVQGGRATLQVRGLPAAPEGQVYQVWLKTGDGAPRPTHTLFTVRPDGRAAVNVDEAVDGVDELLVTAEPTGGSTAPTSAPVLTATLT